MTVADKVHQRVLILPEPLQSEVLNFVEFLLTKVEPDRHSDLQVREDQGWFDLSLTMAMRGMEDEKGPTYTLADLKETY